MNISDLLCRILQDNNYNILHYTGNFIETKWDNGNKLRIYIDGFGVFINYYSEQKNPYLVYDYIDIDMKEQSSVKEFTSFIKKYE